MSSCMSSLDLYILNRRSLHQLFHANNASVRFLDLVKPFTPLLPEIASPETKVPFQQVRCAHLTQRPRD
jgi:hypothetical protein